MDRRVRRELGSHVFDPLCECALVCEKQAVGAADVVNLLAREATPPQADDVEAREMGAKELDTYERKVRRVMEHAAELLKDEDQEGGGGVLVVA